MHKKIMQCATLLINTSKAIFLVLKWQISNANLFTTEILGIFFCAEKMASQQLYYCDQQEEHNELKTQKKSANFTELLLITTNKYL